MKVLYKYCYRNMYQQQHSLIIIVCCLSLKGSFDDFTELSAMLLFTLKCCRFYMSESDQEFSSTAGLMLDGLQERNHLVLLYILFTTIFYW